MARLGPIPASSQFAAIAWLRWRLFANGFRRKGGTGELVARIIVFPIAALFVIGPVAGASIAGYASASNGHLEYLPGIFWAIFVVQMLVSINISPPGLSFDPESLIRFPLSFPRYLTVRLFLGLLAASTIVGTGALLGAATGISVAVHSLAPVAVAAALAVALANLLFIRMIFAWVDRWLSTRRARELFTGLIFAFSIGIQYVNITFNTGRHGANAAARQAKIAAVLRFYHHFEPYLHRLPPGLAADAILRDSQKAPASSLALIVGILLFAAAFLAVFAWRMQREYRGENLSEAAKAPIQSPVQPNSPAGQRLAKLENTLTQTAPVSAPAKSGLLSPIVTACLQKEWISVRRNPAQFYGLIVPIAMVFILVSRFNGIAKTGLIFPAAIAYSILGIAALAYNVLGLDAAGVQFYFLAPISFRSVMLAKNFFGFSITALQIVLVYIVLLFTTGAPPILVTLSTLSWTVFAVLVNATVGNIRSITAPKKLDPGKIARKQASQLSGLMCVGIMLVVAALGAGLIALARFAGIDWLPIPILLALALGAFTLYTAGLNRADSMALSHRESLIEELCKAS